MVTIILAMFAVLGVMFLFVLVKDIIAHKTNLGRENYVVAFIIGVVTDFFDTLGIGSFATTTLAFKITKFLDNDQKLPGTLNAAHTIPVLLQAFIFITVVEVEPVTLVSMLVAAMVGAFLGAKVISGVPERKIQLIVGIALVVTAGIMAARQTGLIAGLGEGNEAMGLYGGLLVVAVVGNFILGALMSAGVGLYAPCMAMVYMLGLNPIVAFPIMMGSCAALMPAASVEFIRAGKYSRRGTIGITIGGILGVLAAVYLVTGLDLEILVWIIVAVVLYTGVSMFLKAMKNTEAARKAA